MVNIKLPIIKIRIDWYERTPFKTSYKDWKLKCEKIIFYGAKPKDMDLLARFIWRFKYQVIFSFWVFKRIFGEWYEK